LRHSNPQHGDERPWAWLGLNTRGHDRLSPVLEYEDIARLEVRSGMLEQAEVLAARVV
jgi:hypothetical protein